MSSNVSKLNEDEIISNKTIPRSGYEPDNSGTFRYDANTESKREQTQRLFIDKGQQDLRKPKILIPGKDELPVNSISKRTDIDSDIKYSRNASVCS
jgi:hypothetical protein